MRKTTQYNFLKDTAMGIAIPILIFLGILYIPLSGVILIVLFPMPILFYRLKLGRKMGAFIMILVLSIIIAIIGGISLDILFYSCLLLTGFLLGEYIEKPLSIEKTGIYTCLSTISVYTGFFFFYAFISEQEIISIISKYVVANLEMSLKLYPLIGVAQKDIEIISKSIEAIQYVLVRIMPSLVAIILILVTWINILFIKTIMVKKGIFIQRFEKLNKWKAPEQLVWIVIILCLIVFIPVKNLKIIGLNFIIVLIPVYFFQGIAIVSFFFEKKRFPVILRFFIYTLIAIQQIFLFFIVGLGFFDTWFDFRKLKILNDTKQN